MHGHLNVNLSRCTVTWTSIYHDAWSPERQKQVYCLLATLLDFAVVMVVPATVKVGETFSLSDMLVEVYQNTRRCIPKYCKHLCNTYCKLDQVSWSSPGSKAGGMKVNILEDETFTPFHGPKSLEMSAGPPLGKETPLIYNSRLSLLR